MRYSPSRLLAAGLESLLSAPRVQFTRAEREARVRAPFVDESRNPTGATLISLCAFFVYLATNATAIESREAIAKI